MSTIREDGSTISAGVFPGDSGGTLHANGADISSGITQSDSGTVHVSGPNIASGYGHSPISIGKAFDVGTPLVINSITYQYLGVISNSTGEAEIHLLLHKSRKCILKLYYSHFKPKEDIIKKLRQIDHKDIINILDYGYYQERFFEIMDFAEGGTLEKYLPIKDVSRIKTIVAEIINAYKYCHANGIIHKDIKPQNLYYKNADGTDILIGDFGISTILETGVSRHLTAQSLTVGYAAPEMYGIGGKAYVGKEVDYYALGITIIHIWDGKNPFDGLNMYAISNLTTSGNIHIPEDMPLEIQKLVKGLITVDYTKRWGYDEIQRWLDGEDVPVHFHVKEMSYPPYQFGTNEAAATPEDLAAILKKNFDRGKKHLYSGKLSAWINLFNQGLAVELDRIVEDDYPWDQDAGLQKAIYILDPDEPFVLEIVVKATGGHYLQKSVECRTSEELADVFVEKYSQCSGFTSEIAKPNHPFYLYLESHDAKKEADAFRKYFNTFSAKKALNTVILELRGRDKLKLGGELFFSPDELLKYEDRPFIISQLKDTESALSLWIEGFDDIKKQVDKWRQIDDKDQNEDTIKYALNEGGPLSDGASDKAGIYYEIARHTVLPEPEKAVEALKSCLTADGLGRYFIKIALCRDVFPMKSEIHSILMNFANKDLARKQTLINDLRKYDPKNPLVKRFDDEQKLFDIRKKIINRDLDKQRDKLKDEARYEVENEINIERAKQIDRLKKQYNERNKWDRTITIISALFPIVVGILAAAYINQINLWGFFGVGCCAGALLLFGTLDDKESPSGGAFEVLGIIPMTGIFFSVGAWLITMYISIKELTVTCVAILFLFCYYVIFKRYSNRSKTIANGLPIIDNTAQLAIRLDTIDCQLNSRQAKAYTDTISEIIGLSDEELDRSLKLTLSPD